MCTIHTHTHEHTHRYIHTYIHTYTHAHTHTHKHTHTHTHAHAHSHTCTHYLSLSLTHSLSHTHTYPHNHGLTHVNSIIGQCGDVCTLLSSQASAFCYFSFLKYLLCFLLCTDKGLRDFFFLVLCGVQSESGFRMGEGSRGGDVAVDPGMREQEGCTRDISISQHGWWWGGTGYEQQRQHCLATVWKPSRCCSVAMCCSVCCSVLHYVAQWCCENQVGCGLWMATLYKSQCELGWELFRDRFIGARAPSGLSLLS